MKKIVKKPSMKKGGTVKKALLGSLLGGMGSNLLGGAIGGMFGGGGGGSSTKLQNNNAMLARPNLSGSMKKGGKVTKAKTGTSLGMKSVKAGFDKNPGVTRADIITAATKKAKSGTKMKKAMNGYGGAAASMVPSKKAMMGAMAKPMMKSGGKMTKCKYGCN